MKLYVIRHGQTDWNKKNFLQGDTDIPLNVLGRSQAKRAQEQLIDLKIDICISSPLQRAYETASILCNGKCEIVKDIRLQERDLGELEGKDATLYDARMYCNYTLNIERYGIEPVQDLFARVTQFYTDLKKKYNDLTVLIVGHGATVRALHYVITGYSHDTDFLSFDVPNCHLFMYEV